MNYLNLIRYKNLLFIAGFQLLLFYCIASPVLEVFQIDAALGAGIIALLVGSSVLIAAGGFVINDYFDTRIDQLNRPDKVIVGTSVSKHCASLLHQIFTIVGVLMGLFVAYYVRSITLGLIVIFIPGLLWFYSASYKRQFLLGNIIVAFMAAFAPLVMLIAQSAFLSKQYGDLIHQTPVDVILYGWFCGFALIVFLTVLIRSIIKNMANEYGDREMESRTLPIVLGKSKTKIILYALIGLTLAIVAWFYFMYIDRFILFRDANSTLAIRYILFGIVLPFGILVYLLAKAKKPADHDQATIFTGFILMLEALFSFVFYFLLCKVWSIPLFGTFLIQ
jgi:4-hydroxybenzoate polyprenyltransferase